MNETSQHYTQRILGNLDGREPLALQAATAEKLARLTEDVIRRVDRRARIERERRGL